MTYQVLEKYSYTTVRLCDKGKDRLTSDVPSIQTLINQEVPTLTATSSFASLVEYKVIVYKSFLSTKE